MGGRDITNCLGLFIVWGAQNGLDMGWEMSVDNAMIFLAPLSPPFSTTNIPRQVAKSIAERI